MTFEVQRPKSHILTTVLALLFVVGAIPLGLFGMRLTAFNQGRLEGQQQELQLAAVERVASESAEFVSTSRAEVEGLARGVEAALAIGPATSVLAAIEDQALLERYLAEDRSLLKLVFAMRAERSGFEWPTLTVGTIPLLVSVAPEDVVSATAEERLVTLIGRAMREGTVVDTAVEDPPFLVVASPVTRRGDIVGAIAALVGLDELRSRLRGANAQLHLTYVTDGTGREVLAASRPREADRSILDSELVAAFRRAGGTRTMPFAIATAAGEETEMVGAFTTVAETGWGVFVQIEAAKAYIAVRRMRETTAKWSVLSVLLALVFGALFARQLVGPIRELAEGALRLARGDFSRRIDLKSGNELGLLAGSFNHMADEIQDQLEKLEAAARENKELFLSTVKMLAEAIDEKDPYTRGHSERVTRYAVAVARAMGLDEDAVEQVQIGALLHDVGKIGIDDRILRKPTMLTEAEFEIMKQHPEKGAHIMGAVRQLADIVPGMRFHHEKVDGTGYPLGLKGDEIPIAAQIISVADTFDAMTTDRPYQKAMDARFVIGKLRGWVDQRFRADVIDAFEQAFDQGEISIGEGPASAAKLEAV